MAFAPFVPKVLFDRISAHPHRGRDAGHIQDARKRPDLLALFLGWDDRWIADAAGRGIRPERPPDMRARALRAAPASP